jgi:spore germination protein
MKKFFTALFFCLLLSGCSEEKIIDRIKIIESIGYDTNGNTYKSSSSYAAFEKNLRLHLFTAESQTFSGVWISLTAQSDDQVVLGQMRTIVISEKLARKGIQELVKGLLRDQFISNNSHVLITNGDANEILTENLQNPPFFLSDLVKQNMAKGNTPFTNTHLMLDQYYGEGQDVFLPVVNKNKNGSLHLDGVGVFKKNKLRLLLNKKEALFIKLLKDKSRTMTGYYELQTDQNETIHFKILQGKCTFSTPRKDKVIISLKLKTELRDLPITISAIEKSDFLDLKKKIEQHISKELSELLKKLQLNTVDPVGFGELYRNLHLIIWMIYKMLDYPARDIIGLHQMIFGKTLGNAVSLLMIGYFIMLALSAVRTYIDVLQVWIFPTVKTWEVTLVFFAIIYYIVSGGFRVLTGIAFFAVLTSSVIFILTYFPTKYGNLSYLSPVWSHSTIELLKSTLSASNLFIGFESILLFFPFIRSTKKHAKWAHFGLLFTTLQYCFVAVSTLMYFSQGLLEQTLYPLLVVTKIIQFPFAERFEFIFILGWFIVLLPSLCLSFWSCTRILKRVMNFTPSTTLPVILTSFIILVLQFSDRIKIDELNRFVAKLGFCFHFGYIPFIFVLFLIRTNLFRLFRSSQ